MRKAVDFIEANFTDVSLSAGDVADHIGVTPEYLSRMFDESLGKSPLTVVNELRSDRARHLLANPRLNLGEIANLCGYRSTRQLRRWFKKFTGQSPAVCRLDFGAVATSEDQESDTNIK
jgi:transcriptional regulator GlxA family with amidase domain